MDTDMKYIFYVETIEAYSFKVLFELLEKNFKSVHFKVNKDGIFICMLSEKNKLIIESSFYGKFMNEFEFNGECESFIFSINISYLKELKITKKTNILILSCEKDSRMMNIQVSNPDNTTNYLRDIDYVQNFFIDIPQGYCNNPINLNKSNNLDKLCKEIITKGEEKIRLQLKKNTLKISCDTNFTNSNYLVLGKNNSEKVLYENVFKAEHITNSIKISSFETLRIYYGEDLPILFSAVVGCNSGNINMYISPYFKENVEWGEFEDYEKLNF